MTQLEDGNDPDPLETREWLDSLDAVADLHGSERAAYLIRTLVRHAQLRGIAAYTTTTPYRNTIPLNEQPAYPGDMKLEERLTAIIRWNALAMVVRANKAYGDLGGHIASYASTAEIFETGFNHFFRGGRGQQAADLVALQPHSSPGIYARAFLEGRLSEEHLARYRQEVDGGGLSSYPHPWLMPHFWQFPTGSMGIGPISAIYHARFMRYLENRKLAAMGDRHVWGVFGDGEMDEPESIAALTLAARERLDNLTFVINCNLQRLDGPVRGNGQIIQELESLFVGAGWNVIKVLWGSQWDELFARDPNHALLERFEHTVDGEYQTLGANDGRYNIEHFFHSDPAVSRLVAQMSIAEIDGLKRGGHDFRKLYAAFAAARAHPGRPTVILAKTKKGFGMGRAGESRMTAHSEKKLDTEALLAFRDRFSLRLSDEDVAALRFYRPADGSPEMQYLQARRLALHGPLPERCAPQEILAVPPLSQYAGFALDAQGKEQSTTMMFARLLSALLRDKVLGPRVVPIVADEARTFGMAAFFKQIGIYSPVGQLYEPEDDGSLLAYREARDGQLLEEGITEAGALASWTAAATSYSVHALPMLPFYIFYSMFGFQRVGDLIWAAADQRARGFLIGATAGRTTLGGEGLQHQDGSSHLIAATIPNCRAYDPAFGYELAVIIDHGARQMLESQQDVFYYVTVMNEKYSQPSIPADVSNSIVRGMYRIGGLNETSQPSIRLLGSGAILLEVIAAAELLRKEWQTTAEIWSVTSFSELARNAREVERWNRLHPEGERRRCHIDSCLDDETPVVAASDYVRAYPQLIGAYVRGTYVVLGTDGFGRSDTRAQLRRFFEVDRFSIAVAALSVLCAKGAASKEMVSRAMKQYGIAEDSEAPWTL